MQSHQNRTRYMLWNNWGACDVILISTWHTCELRNNAKSIKKTSKGMFEKLPSSYRYQNQILWFHRKSRERLADLVGHATRGSDDGCILSFLCRSELNTWSQCEYKRWINLVKQDYESLHSCMSVVSYPTFWSQHLISSSDPDDGFIAWERIVRVLPMRTLRW
jgi:hypothetical protein